MGAEPVLGPRRAPPATALTPRARQIVAAARELLEREGSAGLSMRRIAEQLGIRAPSLYKHFADKQAVETALIATGFAEWAERAEAALEVADDPLLALGGAFRGFALAHPHLYRLMTAGPIDRSRLAEVESRAALPVMRAADGDPDLARAIWAFAHGMTILELGGRFPADADLDAAWRRGLEALRPDPCPVHAARRGS